MLAWSGYIFGAIKFIFRVCPLAAFYLISEQMAHSISHATTPAQKVRGRVCPKVDLTQPASADVGRFGQISDQWCMEEYPHPVRAVRYPETILSHFSRPYSVKKLTDFPGNPQPPSTPVGPNSPGTP